MMGGYCRLCHLYYKSLDNDETCNDCHLILTSQFVADHSEDYED